MLDENELEKAMVMTKGTGSIGNAFDEMLTISKIKFAFSHAFRYRQRKEIGQRQQQRKAKDENDRVISTMGHE